MKGLMQRLTAVLVGEEALYSLYFWIELVMSVDRFSYYLVVCFCFS